MSIRNVARVLVENTKASTAFMAGLHSTLVGHGFDGNGRFESHSQGIAKLHDALAKHGLTITDHVQAPVGNTPSGQHTLRLGWLHPEGRGDPTDANALVHVQWTNLTHTPGDVGPHGDMPTAKPPRFEFLAYVPSRLAPAVTKPTPANERALTEANPGGRPEVSAARAKALLLAHAGHDRLPRVGYETKLLTHGDHHVWLVNHGGTYHIADHGSVREPIRPEVATKLGLKESIFDSPHHSTHYIKVAKRLAAHLDKHAVGYDKEGATPAMRDAQYASFVLKNPQATGYATAISGAHDVLQKHFATPDTPEGRVSTRLMSAARIYIAGHQGKTTDADLDHMYKMLRESDDNYDPNICDDCGRPHVDGMTLNSTGRHNKRLCYQSETGADPFCAALAAKRAGKAKPQNSVLPKPGEKVAERGVPTPSFVAANQFRITPEEIAGGTQQITISDPTGVAIGGVHRGQMFLKKTAMAHRAGAAQAWREYQTKTGKDGQGATFDGVMECAVRAPDPETARLIEWDVAAVDAISVTVLHPDTGRAYRLSLHDLAD